MLPASFKDIPLIKQAQYSLEIPNAGGSSSISEALSMQYMKNRFGAIDFLPEMDVPYWIEYKMCDFLMLTKSNEWVGVSVTRAVTYPFDQEYTLEKAIDLLRRKLYGLIVAREAVMEEYGFSKSILHIWCYNIAVARTIMEAHKIAVDDESYDQVHIICTVCTNKYVYTNRIL